MVAHIPVLKVGILLFKEAAKPISKMVKAHAHEHPVLKKISIKTGLLWEINAQRLENIVTKKPISDIKTVSEQKALATGTDLMSQSFLILVAIALLVFEVDRTNKNKAMDELISKQLKRERQLKKEERLRHIEEELRIRNKEAEERIEYLENHIKELEDELHTFQRKKFYFF